MRLKLNIGVEVKKMGLLMKNKGQIGCEGASEMLWLMVGLLGVTLCHLPS